MPMYKLTYFNWRARAEVSRMLFAIAGVDYQDNRVSFEEWPELKCRTPFGKLPTLEVDGDVICQSHAIERYLAKSFGLAGETSWEQAKVDMVVDSMEDFLSAMLKIYYCKDEKMKASLTENFLENELPTFMSNLEKLLLENRNGNGYIVGDHLTFADLAVYHHPTTMKFCTAHDFDISKWPKLQAHKARVESHPKLVNWLRTRPQTVV